MSRHEVDDLRRNRLRSADKIPLVFTILVVNDNDHFAIADFLNSLFNGVQFYFAHVDYYQNLLMAAFSSGHAETICRSLRNYDSQYGRELLFCTLQLFVNGEIVFYILFGSSPLQLLQVFFNKLLYHSEFQT